MRYSAFLGLGSNLGQREKHLNTAVAELKRMRSSRLVWTSNVYETDPVGKISQPKFLNACVEMETELSPGDLHAETKSMEARLGRTSTERWGPREIDVDILLYDGVVFDKDGVTVPHPEMEHRRFVLVPLNDIAADLVHPVTGLTVAEMLKACKDQSRVVQSHHRLLA
jgi:2-amino-4-hydroxy-6-hydroxymethyldihydropteridine diphosphokinase